MSDYGTRVTCRFGAAPVLASTEDRDTGWTGTMEDYATGMLALARKEGKRRGLPPAPPPADRSLSPASRAILAHIAAHPEVSKPTIMAALGLSSGGAEHGLSSLLRGRLVAVDVVEVPRRPREWRYTLTPAGRARLMETA